MKRLVLSLSLSIAAAITGCAHAPPAPSRTPLSPDAANEQYKAITPSLVAVQYVWESELGRREIIGAGIVVGDDGLVMTSIALVGQQIPDAQMKEFKVIVPSDSGDPEELDAVFQGRDERTEMAFIKNARAAEVEEREIYGTAAAGGRLCLFGRADAQGRGIQELLHVGHHCHDAPRRNADGSCERRARRGRFTRL